jgi:hypothetical protein
VRDREVREDETRWNCAGFDTFSPCFSSSPRATHSSDSPVAPRHSTISALATKGQQRIPPGTTTAHHFAV